MGCKYQTICGGCPLRHLDHAEYKKYKSDKFSKILSNINQSNIKIGDPVFIDDGHRRRAELAFQYRSKNLTLGFNVSKSHEIIDIDSCPALSENICTALSYIKDFLHRFCAIKQTVKLKGKIQNFSISRGDICITEAENGLDILLSIDRELCLEHRLEICDFINSDNNIIRISVLVKSGITETIAEKAKPFILIGEREVFIPSGTFLQASKEGELALIDLVEHYIGNTSGMIADLFCGVGTFSYPLSKNIKNKITSIDSSEELLNGFRQTINKLMIPNIKIVRRNLFKYPLDCNELKQFEVVVFDPPRAGAAAQVKQISLMNDMDKPQKIVAISCNPHTFVNDANTLISSGYNISEITMVDQFVRTDHIELVALFEKY